MIPVQSNEHPLADLFHILAIMRKADSYGELELIKRFIIPTGADRDDFGNWYLRIGTAPVMWSCHTDTVHHMDIDSKHYYQKLSIDDHGFLSVPNSSCLGADNGVGVWLMLEMIKQRKEGLYIFHRKEEIGGQGSNYISSHTPELVNGIQYAIAFDRRGIHSVITHQGTRCCSDEFADSLITALDMGHEKDDGGTFTDTANYTHLIPECTNISAGFYNEHTYKEMCDTSYAQALREAVIKLDVESLVVKRRTCDPAEYAGGWWTQGGFRTYKTEGKSRASDFWDDDYGYDGSGYNYERERIKEDPEACYQVLVAWGLAGDIVADMDKL